MGERASAWVEGQDQDSPGTALLGLWAPTCLTSNF